MQHPERRASPLARAMTGVTLARSDDEAALEVLRGVMEVTGAARGRLRFVDLGTGAYAVGGAIGWTGPPARLRPAELRDRPLSSLSTAERAIASGLAQLRPALSDAVLPVMRGATCIGLFELEADGPGAFGDPSLTDDVGPLASLAIQLYERRFLLRVMSESQQPLDVAVHDDEFYEQVMTLVAVASDVEYAALHFLEDDGELVCVAAFGFDGLPVRQIDEDRLVSSSILRRAVTEQRPVAGRDIGTDTGGFEKLLRDQGVRSVVTLPVVAGGGIYGCLSLASTVDYEFSAQEIDGFSSIATGVGIAIQNHRSVHAAAVTNVSYAEIGLAITGVEVAQAARHEARGLIDDCLVATVILGQEARKVAPGRAAGIQARLDEIDETLNDLARVVDKIKAATRAPRRERSLIGLHDIWDQARSQLQGKVHQARLESCRYDGPDVPVFVAVDWFRQVFINLMLNSLDAFNTGAMNKRGRQIRLVVDRPSDRQRDYQLTYSDNAGGINPASLRHLDGSPIEMPPEQAIFEANVTSKPEGSGWGLVLVRRILEDHRGTINVVDHRGGLTYRIQIPKPSERETRRTDVHAPA